MWALGIIGSAQKERTSEQRYGEYGTILGFIKINVYRQKKKKKYKNNNRT